jgi:hypothetical protein
MEQGTSVTLWLDRLKEGERDAAQKLFNAYYTRLVRLAHKKLANRTRRVADEEDVALAAFHSFCNGVKLGRFPRLESRDDLWQVLVMVTARKAIDQNQAERRQKRGGGRVRGESVFARSGEGGRPLEEVVGREPTPEFAALLAEEMTGLLERLEDETLRELALLKLETVERKLARIRAAWKQGTEP